MKLYYFNPNTYGQQYFVCAESPEYAKQALLSSININDDFDAGNKISAANLEDGYTLESFEPGQVVETEIC